MATKLIGVPIPSINWKSSSLHEEYRKFKRHCECIFNGLLKDEDEVVKIQYLLLWSGPDGADICDGWQLSDADKVKLDVHWSKFDSHVQPKSSFRVARFQLRALKQNNGESIDSFLTRIKVLLRQCQYKEPDEMLLDTLIAGVNDESVQRKLISKDKELTVDKALDIIRAYESTKSQMNDIMDSQKVHAGQKSRGRGVKQRWSGQATGEQHKPQFDKFQHSQKTVMFKSGVCWNCGKSHARDDKCPASEAECYCCHKMGHFSNVCLSKNQGKTPKRGQTGGRGRGRCPGQSSNRVHELQNDVTSPGGDVDDNDSSGFGFDCIEFDTCSFDVIHVDDETKEVDSIVQKDEAFANVQVQPHDEVINIRCKIDTGAQTNVMPLRVVSKLFPEHIDNGIPVGLQATPHKITGYGGVAIKQFGLCQLRVTHKSVDIMTTFFVTDAPGCTMLGLRACVELGLVTLNCETSCVNCHNDSDISAVTKQSFHADPNHPSYCPYGAKKPAKEDVMTREPSTFSLREEDIGDLPGTYHITMQDGAEASIYPPHRVPVALRERFKQKLDWMVKHKFARKVDEPTDWVNNVVLVTKSNGDIRICLDPKDLNRWIRREHHFTPTLDDILPRLSNSKVFSVLDARSGYWNVHLDEQSQLLTTFNTPWGRYCFMRLPFGLISAQDVFQKKMDVVLDGSSGAACISDDVIVWGKTADEHDMNLYDTFKRSQANGVKYNANKCQIKEKKVKFYGHYMTADGLEMDPDKVQAICSMPEPSCATELQSILGMINYLSRFSKELANITAPLRDLTRHDVDFQWHPEHQKAFEKMKQEISSPKTLAYFDGHKPVTIQTDASQRGVGAALLQEGKPVVYASKSLTPTEQGYSNIEREMLGVVFGMERFHHYAFGRRVTVETDHKPLQSIWKKEHFPSPSPSPTNVD